MTTAPPPAPGPSGYQPVQGEGFTHLDVEVRPSFGFQTVGITGRYVFPAPRPYADVLQPYDDIFRALKELAVGGVNDLVAARDAFEQGKAQQAVAAVQAPAPVQQAPAPTVPVAPAPAAQPATAPAAPVANGAPQWAFGAKPEGKGTLRYIPSSVLPTEQFKAIVQQQLPALGIDPSQVVVYDNRVGNYGLEGGNTSWGVGVVKPTDTSPLKGQLGKRSLAWVNFEDDGSLSVNVSKDGQAALAGLQIAQQMQGQQVPAPAEDMPF